MSPRTAKAFNDQRAADAVDERRNLPALSILLHEIAAVPTDDDGRGVVMKRRVEDGDLGTWLASIGPGRAACILSDAVEDARNVVEQLVTAETEPARVVCLTWRDVPPLSNELGLLVQALSDAVLELFPSLYGLEQPRQERFRNADVETQAHAASRRAPEVNGAACRQILSACHAARAPELEKLAPAERVRQLALALDPERLVVVITVTAAPATPARLRSLAHGAEWLAANARSRVVLVLPAELHRAEELDHVSYSSYFLRAAASLPAPRSAERARPAASRGDSSTVRRTAANTVVIGLSATPGAPHPKSESERLLHRALSADTELRALFKYNQRVATRCQSSPIVDLLWDAGRLVIEIDGDDHRGQFKYREDRKRDRELLLSGYRVVRIVDSWVLDQCDAVVEQIREIVRYIQTLSFTADSAPFRAGSRENP